MDDPQAAKRWKSNHKKVFFLLRLAALICGIVMATAHRIGFLITVVGFPIEIETKISKLITYITNSLAIFIK